jgi:hypothetical protein
MCNPPRLLKRVLAMVRPLLPDTVAGASGKDFSRCHRQYFRV